jgi:hypothetical protein
LSGQVPHDVYKEAAEEAFRKLSAEERIEFVRQVQARGRDQNVDLADLDMDSQPDAYQDPGRLAAATAEVQQKKPDLLGQLLGGGGGGLIDNPIAKAALGGIAAMAAKKVLNR